MRMRLGCMIGWTEIFPCDTNQVIDLLWWVEAVYEPKTRDLFGAKSRKSERQKCESNTRRLFPKIRVLALLRLATERSGKRQDL